MTLASASNSISSTTRSQARFCQSRPKCHFVVTDCGMVEQALVDVADLFDVESPEREPASLLYSAADP